MDEAQHADTSGDHVVDPGSVLEQVRRYLDELDTWKGDLATDEDFIIMECLLAAVRAAQHKGYGEELLVQLLRSVIRTPTGRS